MTFERGRAAKGNAPAFEPAFTRNPLSDFAPIPGTGRIIQF